MIVPTAHRCNDNKCAALWSPDSAPSALYIWEASVFMGAIQSGPAKRT